MKIFGDGGELSTKGRLNRLAYFGRMFLTQMVYKIIEIVAFNPSRSAEDALMIIAIPFLILLVLNYVFIAKRLQDLDISGYWAIPLIIISFIMFSGVASNELIIILGIVSVCTSLALALKKGTNGPNRFGEDPLAPNPEIIQSFAEFNSVETESASTIDYPSGQKEGNNLRQLPLPRKLLIGYLLCTMIACIYVPWQRVHPANPALRRSMGYTFIWKVPNNGSVIDYGKIGLEFLVVSAVFGIVYLTTKDKQ